VGGAFVALRLVARLTGKSVSRTVSVLVVGPLRFEDRVGGAAACFSFLADITGASTAVTAVSFTTEAAFVLGFLPRVFTSEVVSGGAAAAAAPAAPAFFDALFPFAAGSLGIASLQRVLFTLPFAAFTPFLGAFSALASSTTVVASPTVSANAATSGRVHFSMVLTGLKDLR